MVVLSTLRRDRHEIEYAEKAKAWLGVQPAIDFYGGPELDKEDELDDKGKTTKPTDQHRVFDVPLDPKNKDKSTLTRDSCQDIPIRYCRRVVLTPQTSGDIGDASWT
jgi:hypothetical protein